MRSIGDGTFLRSLVLAAAAAGLVSCGGGAASPSVADSGTDTGTNDTSDAGGTTEAGACASIHGPTALLTSPLPTDEVFDTGLASDGQYVYFSGARGLYRVAVAGGALETVYAGPVAAFAAAAGTTVWVLPDTNPTHFTVKNANGVHDVALPSGVVLLVDRGAPMGLVDAGGSIFFEVSLASGGTPHTWRWNPATDTTAEMPGVGEPDAGAFTNLYWVDHGDIIWSNGINDPTGGIYATDVSNGTARQLVGPMTTGFGTMVGMDATNVYGAGSICPRSACPFTIYGVPLLGGAPFVAYQTADAYWTNGLRADDSGLYWSDWQVPGIYHVALTKGAQPELIAHTGSIGVSQFALDTCNVYWLDANATGSKQQVMAVAK